MYCKVKYCRFPYTHTTGGHKCGIKGCLHPYGHGQVEHYNEDLKCKLIHHQNDMIPSDKQCTITGCKYTWSHTNESHLCYKCKRRGVHCSKDCIIQSLDSAATKWGWNKEKIEEFIRFKNNIIFEINVGMGCSVFVSHKNNVTNTIFMHQDSWGQYGEATDDTPILNNFRDGLDCVNDDWILFNEPVETSKKCPMCRKINLQDDIKFIKGLDAKCVVCMENDIEVYFSACEHSVVCKTCLEQLDDY
jgi:hypothetical protein